MSSAANDKRGKLEEEFQSRMYDAEASPSQHLWDRIDHELTVQENGAYKQHAGFYRQLAAACITLLLLAGGLGAWYFSSPAGTEQPIATVAPATNSGPAATLSAPSEEAEMAGAVAATTTPPKQAERKAPAPGATEINPAAPAPAALGAIAEASSTTSRSKTGVTDATALPQPDAGNDPVAEMAAVTLTIAETKTPDAVEEAVEKENPLILSRSLRQTIAALSATEQQAGNSPALLQQPFAAKGAEAKATDDFRKLNEQVMAHAKRMEEEQKARLLAYNEAAASKKDSEKENSKGNSRWSLGMAYAPGYFNQNIGSSGQDMSAASDQMSLMPSSSSSASISSLYMDEAREEYAENADPGFSFGFEAKTGFKLGKKLKLLTGLGFLQNTTRSRSSYMVQESLGNSYARGFNSSGPSTVFIPSISSNLAADSLYVTRTPEYKVNQRHRFLTVPVGLQYEGNMGKDWFWYGGAGVAANILLQTTILASSAEVEDVAYDLQDDSPFRKLQWSGNVSGGVGKRLGGNMSVTVGPEFRSYFNTLLAETENAPLPQGRPYAVGLNMAVNYELNAGKKSR
ncbi:PorT family protein [Pontibacter diazotrophicus]|uniref:PorT family protein n=1 Tax=Pontibacter diazotrophicus TaxID=1400979 RepID=A0A3D8LEG5_9BACT|nr:outer membrane beta-barrel protein [Pontibacter diazotrophicus]RDV15664.1 PorT family protein [Pontibacter diazotrophicus]